MEENLIAFDSEGTTYIGTGLTDDKDKLHLRNYLVWQTSDLVSRGMGYSEDGKPGLSNYAKIVRSTYEQAKKDSRLIDSVTTIPTSKGITHYLGKF